jgi:hypothetical protein
MTKQKLPKGWTEKRIREVVEYYDSLSDDEWLAEHEAARAKKGYTTISVPDSLLPTVRKLITAHATKERSGRMAAMKR